MVDLNRNVAPSSQGEEESERESLCLKIRNNLEEMLSNSHLAEDSFLLKHIQRNRQGYVSLKLLTCLKTIKTLTTNWHITLAAAKGSALLEVNDEATKVRRKEPLPQRLMCSPTSRLLLMWINPEHAEDKAARNPGSPSLLLKTIQKFTSPISITSFWFLHPGEELPKELQCYTKRHKELSQHLCAVVKFVSLEALRETLNALRAEEMVGGKRLCMLPLGYQSPQSFSKCQPSEEENTNRCEKDTCSEEVSEVLVQKESLHKIYEETSKSSPHQVSQDTLLGDKTLTICGDQSSSHLDQGCMKTGWSFGDNSVESSHGPWVRRRKFAAQNPNAVLLKAPCSILRVLRKPSGPDDTKGFRARAKEIDFIG
ncbi:la-related protein 6 [Nothobranchius furzeri]|uniref:La-related protein 6-like n=1 Tax=Nothobranchius furzeri TaxID=105023 RepID=A0A8C6Q315_NOTFU|nr:la-related protein 6 [Nothobranchius furzeri]KAF7222175.1 la-related protein 6-like [Nothobranchius furzeri]